jgi:probable F420-dependent oxidoreductase
MWIAEAHLASFDVVRSPYPYTADGKMPSDPDDEAGEPDAFLLLSYLAAITQRVRLGTGVCVLPQRNPLYVAKQVTSLDQLSNGRVDFGVGIGWMAEEFEAADAPWEARGERCRSYLAVARSLWCDDDAEHHDEFYDLPRCRQRPRPVQRPHPPVYFGGNSDAALRRAAELGTGWYGIGLAPDAVRDRVARLAELGGGGAPPAIAVSPGRASSTTDMSAYADAGVDQLVLPMPVTGLDEVRRRLDEFAELAASDAIDGVAP